MCQGPNSEATTKALKGAWAMVPHGAVSGNLMALILDNELRRAVLQHDGMSGAILGDQRWRPRVPHGRGGAGWLDHSRTAEVEGVQH